MTGCCKLSTSISGVGRHEVVFCGTAAKGRGKEMFVGRTISVDGVVMVVVWID